MLQIIYIPGLGDNRVGGQRLAVHMWRFWGVKPQLFQMNWADGEQFELKFNRLLQAIDAAQMRGEVALVAASAGASAAINAYAKRPNIRGIVCIAGKINNPQTIGERYRQKNPAFWEAAQRTTHSLALLGLPERQRILSIRAWRDGIVPARDSTLEGAHNRVAWAAGHPIVIAQQLIFGASRFINFLRSIDK